MNSNITISYAIPVCNEYAELFNLLHQINEYVKPTDQIVIQIDKSNTIEPVKDVINRFTPLCKCELTITEFDLNKDFASFKNHLKSKCTRDYIFQIDADEYLGNNLLKHIHMVLTANPDVDLYFIPRINLVKGLTVEYAKSQHWNLQNLNFPVTREYEIYEVINFPDRQQRLFKNVPYINWQNKVHECIVGYKTYCDLMPKIKNLEQADSKTFEVIQNWSLIHIKDFERQKRQNKFYETLNKGI